MTQKDPSMNKMMELSQKDDPESKREWGELMRSAMSQFMKVIESNPFFTEGIETVTSSLSVPTTHDGDFDVPVFVYTPTSLEGKNSRGAYIYAHGGGAVAGKAEEFATGLKYHAVQVDMVVFNVDYRLAPETKCPNNIKDFYEVIKYVSANAESLGIDPSKIVIAGESGGGYITLGAMVLLAENDEGGLVKLAIPGVPMVDDYCFSDPLCMTQEEREAASGMKTIWNLIADNMEEQKSSPYLFPGKASDEILAKFPPTIIMEAEFDMFITEATRLSYRLRRVGRLLEFLVIPGHTHVSTYVPGCGGFAILTEALQKIKKEYIDSDIVQK